MNIIRKKSDFDIKTVEHLKESLQISDFLAVLLSQRGIDSPEAANYFFNADLTDLTDPFTLSGMADACNRIEQALATDEPVLIYGDYDVDGICSVVLLHECFAALGKDVSYYVPDRFSEGYGLNTDALQRHAQTGFKLIITVDCGITSCDEAEFCKALGLDLIITDHHTPGEKLPDACAIVNPKLDNYPAVKDLAGVGVAFKLAMAMFIVHKKKIPSSLMNSWLELVGLGTVADVVPLLQENRILVKNGLLQLQNTKRPGLKKLLEKLYLSDRKLRSQHIAFSIAPKLNSAGRMDSANKSIELLLTKNDAQAELLTNFLLQIDQKRKHTEDEIFQQAIDTLTPTFSSTTDNFLIVTGEKWNIGVIGIVASRLVNIFQRPIIIISWEEDLGKGSCRSYGNVDIFLLLSRCREHLVQFGGHKLAAGLTINRKDFSNFQKALTDHAANLFSVLHPQEHQADLELFPEDIGSELMSQLEKLEPFGEGNPIPRFIMREQTLFNPAFVGKDKEHLRFNAQPGNYPAIAFNQASQFSNITPKLKHDLLFELQENEFRGQKNLQYNIINFISSAENLDASSIHPAFNHIDCLNLFKRYLQANEPVCIIFPNVATLNLFKPWLQSAFTAAACKIIHGFSAPASKKHWFQQFSQGYPQISAITLQTWLAFLKTESLPTDFKHLYSLDPGEEISEKELEKLKKQGSPVPIKLWHNPFTDNSFDFVLAEKIPAKAKVFVNQPETINVLSEDLDDFYTETFNAGFAKRVYQRKQWKKKRSVLFTNADFIPCQNFDRQKKSLYVANPFYSFSELILFSLESAFLNSPREIFIHSALCPYPCMRHELARLYPHHETIREFVRVLSTLPTGGLALTSPMWLSELNQHSTLQLNIVEELESLLTITAELSLCEWEKHGNIFSIKPTIQSTLRLDLTNSLYYMEGLAVKKTYLKVEQFMLKHIK